MRTIPVPNQNWTPETRSPGAASPSIVTGMPNELEVVQFPTTADLWHWLDQHHATHPGVWVQLQKSGSRLPSISFRDLLEAGIAFGWSESSRRAHDRDSYLQKFTPRRTPGTTSRRNLAIADRLESEGRMTPAGRAALRRSLDQLAWPRATERLELRRMTPSDAVAVFAYRSDPVVARWMTALPTDQATFVADFSTWGTHQLAVCRDGVLIGDAMVRVGDAWAQSEVAEGGRRQQAELGWCLSPAAQGHGYGTEVARELLAIAFDGLRVRRVEANCFAENVASWRIMERLGRRRETHAVAESLHRDGTWHDGFTYALLADEWRGGSASGLDEGQSRLLPTP